MAEIIKLHDFVEVDYTGRLSDGTVFDTTLEKVAKENKINAPKMKYSPHIVCVGEKQLLPGLDQQLIDKEVGEKYIVTLPPEKAFGKRDIKKLKIVPSSMFKEQKIQPQLGLQIDIEGEIGTISRISGGRIIVNFNHPLAGKEVSYTFKINKLVTDNTEKVSHFLALTLRIPKDKIEVEIKENKAVVSMPVNLPEQIINLFAKKLVDVTDLKEVKFNKKE